MCDIEKLKDRKSPFFWRWEKILSHFLLCKRGIKGDLCRCETGIEIMN